MQNPYTKIVYYTFVVRNIKFKITKQTEYTVVIETLDDCDSNLIFTMYKDADELFEYEDEDLVTSELYWRYDKHLVDEIRNYLNTYGMPNNYRYET